MDETGQVDSPTQIDDVLATGETPKTEQLHALPHIKLEEASRPLAAYETSHFDTLPPEIVSIIAASLDVETAELKAFRGVNKTCAGICTRLLFRDVRLLINTTSMAHLHCILGNPDIRHAVTNVIINTAEYTDRNMDTFDWDDRDGELLKRFNHYLSRVGRFCNLKSVYFKFSKSCVGPPLRRHWWASQVPESVGFRMEALQSLFKGLNDTNNPMPRFHDLTIENLQDWADDSLVQSVDFKAVMARVKRLQLQIATEHDDTAPMKFIEKKELHDFFDTQLSQEWLSTCASNLTHLKLYAGAVYWGYIPKCTLPHFPNLKSLSLGKMTFTHDWQLKWILSHSATLEELTLDDCPIVIGTAWFGELDADGYPLDTSKAISSESVRTRLYPARWHSYFHAFRLNLYRLRKLRCGFNDDDWDNAVAFSMSDTLEPRLWPERYRVFDTCWLERPPFGKLTADGEVERGEYDGTWLGVPLYPDCTDEDLTELVRLRETITARTGVEDEDLALLQRLLF